MAGAGFKDFQAGEVSAHPSHSTGRLSNLITLLKKPVTT